MVIGAGDAGKNLVRELKTSRRINGTPRCIIDDNRNKWGRNIEDVPIVGGRASIFSAVEKYQISTILFAIPTASAPLKQSPAPVVSIVPPSKYEGTYALISL